MERLSSLTIPNFGLKTDDVKYFSMESTVRGRGADRLKSLDLQGRYVLSGSSIPYISSAFNHLERLNNARLPMRDINIQPINAIGLVNWTKSSVEKEEETKRAKESQRNVPKTKETPVREQTPVAIKTIHERRENMPYRSAGYGAASERRHLSVSADRSRSVSPQARSVSANGITASVDRTNGNSLPRPRVNDSSDAWRPPHRTQTLASRSSSRTRQYDSEYEDTSVRDAGENRQYSDELRVNTKGHSLTTEKRLYSVSPRSIGSAGESLSGSELDSPNVRDGNVDEVRMDAYHSKWTTGKPKTSRYEWINN